MSRRKAREMALQAMFQLDYHQTDAQGALQTVFEEHLDTPVKAKEYAEQLVVGACQHLNEIDAVISKTAVEWKPERMPGVDRNIARIAIYELQYGTERLTPSIIINEAVELAKTFGTEDSGRFINGILGALIKREANDAGIPRS